MAADKFKFNDIVWLGFQGVATFQPFIYVGTGESGGTIYYFRQATHLPEFTMNVIESEEYLIAFRDVELDEQIPTNFGCCFNVIRTRGYGEHSLPLPQSSKVSPRAAVPTGEIGVERKVQGSHGCAPRLHSPRRQKIF